VKNLSEHSDIGASNTMAEYQGKRPSLYDFEDEWKKLDLPTLIVCGDEDEPCIQPSIWLKTVLANAGLTFFAKTGHTVNIEEPDLFNRELWNFLALVEAGKWTPGQVVAPGHERCSDPAYSITASARANRIGGNARPISRAAFWLMVSSNRFDW
jgi:hypothetical protein